MRKLLIIFCISWGVYCLISSGHVVSRLDWFSRFQLSPSGVQERAGDIFNQGAVKASKRADIPHPDVAVLFVEDEEGLLKALPLTYWLYPTYLTPASSKYFEPGGGLVKDDVNVALQLALAKPEGRTIFYVGRLSTLENNSALLTGYSQKIIDQVDQDYLVVLEKK